MAVYRFSASIIGRSGGRSATAAAAYRAAEKIVDDRTGETHDYSRKGGVIHSEIMVPEHTPEWMTDRQQLWNAVEAVENRKNSQLAREILLSLPHELTDDERRELIRDFVQGEFVSRGMIADLAIHLPGGEGDERNHHAHVMLTMRELAGDGWAKNKNRDWNKKEVLEGWRERWADHQNERFATLGYDLEVDHRSREERGEEGIAEPKLGPRNSRLMRDGLTNERIEAWKSARAEREELHRVNSEIARFETWAAARKADLARERLDQVRELELKHDTSRTAVKDMLDNFYSPDREKAEAALKAVQERQERVERDGVTKAVRQWWYRVTEASERDHELSQQSRHELDEIEDKTKQHLAGLDIEHGQESENLDGRFDRRQAAQSAAIDKRREERKAKWWAAMPEREETSTTAKWWRAQEPDKDQSQPEKSQDRGKDHEPER